MRITIDVEDELAIVSKKIVKDNGFFWEFALKKILEKELTELVRSGNVEKIIK